MKKIITYLFFVPFIVLAEHQVPYLENSRLTLDLSSRFSYFEKNEELSARQFIGFDFYKAFNNGKSDIGYLILQPYLLRIDNGVAVPPFHDDPHDWEYTLRTAIFTFTGLGNGMPWLRLGHFELPFGLEHSKNTFGNLHQFDIAGKLGMKVDWGIALGQEMEHWQYVFSLTRGSGLKYRDRENPYALTGRVASLYDDYWSWGFSFFHGEILKGKSLQERSLIAVDLEYYFGRFGILAELQTGEVDKQQTYGGLIELNWTNNDDSLELYAQYVQRTLHESPHFSNINIGGVYRYSENIIFSSQISFDLNDTQDGMKNSIFEFQIRYLF